jgi:hypothetical protein
VLLLAGEHHARLPPRDAAGYAGLLELRPIRTGMSGAVAVIVGCGSLLGS